MKAAQVQIEPSGPLTWLWGTAFVYGNVFAIVFLATAILHAHPIIKLQLGNVIASCWGWLPCVNTKRERTGEAGDTGMSRAAQWLLVVYMAFPDVCWVLHTLIAAVCRL